VTSTAGSSPVTWWADTWWRQDVLSGGTAPAAFKGFVGTLTLPTKSPANVCAGPWATAPGGSTPPPAIVPSYMGVVVTKQVKKSGSSLSGTYFSIVVVKVDPGYAPNPFAVGTGTIVATFCP